MVQGSDATEPPQISNLTITSTAPLAASFSLSAKPNKVYYLEYTTNLLRPNWQVHSLYTNAAPTDGRFDIKLENPLPPGESQRYYRVRLNP